MSRTNRSWIIAKTLATLVALVGIEGCSRTQLRVIATEHPFRAGRLEVGATTFVGDQAPPLSFTFADPNRTSASFLFRFNTSARSEFLTVVTTQFVPDVPRPDDECVLSCQHFMELRPGHSYRIETPILILPGSCSTYYGDGSDGYTAALNVCAAANRLVQIPGCDFEVTTAPACVLICPNEPPEDPDPGASADATGQQSAPQLVTPNEYPTLLDASSEGGSDAAVDASVPDASILDASTPRPDAGFDAGPPDVSLLPLVCGGFANDCDGRVVPDACPSGTTCSGGQCLSLCVEGGCLPGQSCRADGLCVDTACLSVSCPASNVCVGGACVDPCAG